MFKMITTEWRPNRHWNDKISNEKHCLVNERGAVHSVMSGLVHNNPNNVGHWTTNNICSQKERNQRKFPHASPKIGKKEVNSNGQKGNWNGPDIVAFKVLNFRMFLQNIKLPLDMRVVAIVSGKVLLNIRNRPFPSPQNQFPASIKGTHFKLCKIFDGHSSNNAPRPQGGVRLLVSMLTRRSTNLVILFEVQKTKTILYNFNENFNKLFQVFANGNYKKEPKPELAPIIPRKLLIMAGEEKRRDALQELLETERTYVQRMQITFKVNLMNRYHILKPSQ